MYRYNDPIAMGPLTHIDAVAHYDNSADNLRNPNSPPKAVYWGEQTTDEMLIAFLVFTLDSENLTKSGQLQASWVPPLPR